MFRGEHIDAMLRIEMNWPAWLDLAEEMLRPMWVAHERGREAKFMNVSIYVVEHTLPACGWRIINPFKKEQTT